MDQVNPIQVGKMSSVIQSYDLHQLEEYSRLDELKKVLDSYSVAKTD